MIRAEVARAKAEAYKKETVVEYVDRTLTELIKKASEKGETSIKLNGGEFDCYMYADYGFNIARQKPYTDEKEIKKMLIEAGYKVEQVRDTLTGRGGWEFTKISWKGDEQ